MTTPAQPFDVEAAINKICSAYWGPNVDQAADIDKELITAMRTQITAAYKAGRADAVAVTQVELTPEQRESLHCTNEVQIPGIAQPAVNQAADHWHGLYLQQCLKNKDFPAQPVQPKVKK